MSQPNLDRFSLVGMVVCAAGAAVASADALAQLAVTTNWSDWASWLLPLSVDFLAAVAVRVWLDQAAPAPARRFGRLVAIAAVLVSMAGNAASHLLGTNPASVPWPLVVIVGATPAAALGAVAHLHALRTTPIPGRARHSPPSAGRSVNSSTPQRTPASGSTTSTTKPTTAASSSTSGASRNAARKGSATGARVTAAEFTERAMDAWRPGMDVTAEWVQQAAGCGRTVAYRIAPVVRERVAGNEPVGVVVDFNREESG